MTLAEQYEIFLNQLTTRKRNPAKPATIAAYQSYWRTWVQPQIGSLELSAVENGAMKKLVAYLASKQLAPASIQSISQLVKNIVTSAVDDNGNPLHPRKWNSDFIDSPLIQNQKAPIIDRESVEKAIASATGLFKPLYALLAGSGIRISECAAIRIGKAEKGSYWDPERAMLVINTALWRGIEQSTKTTAGTREVDLAPELNEYLKLYFGFEEGGFMFGTEGESLRVRTAYDIIKKDGIPGFHSMRRFRITHLENVGVPRALQMFWTGHSEKSVHTSYIKLDKDIKARKEWCERAGLGFKLPSGTGD
jgi:integrase